MINDFSMASFKRRDHAHPVNAPVIANFRVLQRNCFSDVRATVVA